MKKVAESIFLCSNCGNEFNKWAGQCGACKEWNTLKEIKNYELRITNSKKRTERVEAVNLGEMGKGKEVQTHGSVPTSENIISTNISEFDRELGKGIVRGSVILFSGEPGIGKSTLLTQLIGKVGGLYVAGEESAEQIGLRVKRLGLDVNKFDILGTNSTEQIVEFLERTQNVFKIVVVDSIQMLYCEGVTGAMGSPSQIKESAFRLIEVAKRLGVAMIIVGHVTKEGDIAGPKLLEHMVDTVLYFEGEKNGDLRILRVTKNRFGSTDEVGVFKMEETGLREIKSDEINLVSASNAASPGSAVTIIVEGSRPMMVEIQALVTESFAPMPKRVFSGIDYNRGQLLVAVTQKVLGVPLYKYDVFVSVSGGIRIEDTGADLAVVAAMYSSYKSLPIPPFDKGGGKTVFVGEVSLLGEVRKVKSWEKRQKEAIGLGRKVVEMGSINELKSL
jgi:DNA repair protein RadA/Sms